VTVPELEAISAIGTIPRRIVSGGSSPVAQVAPQLEIEETSPASSSSGSSRNELTKESSYSKLMPAADLSLDLPTSMNIDRRLQEGT